MIGQGVFILWGVENCHLPLTKPVAVNTGLALPRSPWKRVAYNHVTAIFQRCQKRPKCVVILLLILHRHTFLFPRDFSGTIEDRDIIDTPLEPVRHADVLLGFRWYCLHFMGEIPPKPQFWWCEQAFLSQTGKILKVSYYRNYCIDFIVGGPSRRPTNPWWRTAAILKKPLNHLSTTVRPILMKFSTMTHIGPWHRINR